MVEYLTILEYKHKWVHTDCNIVNILMWGSSGCSQQGLLPAAELLHPREQARQARRYRLCLGWVESGFIRYQPKHIHIMQNVTRLLTHSNQAVARCVPLSVEAERHRRGEVTHLAGS